MRTFLRFISVLILLGSFVCEANAAKRYWVAANDSIWNSTRNWSATSGGAFGASVPGSNDTAYFDGGSVKNDTFDINVSVKRIEISSAYTGTIIQGAKTLTIGTSGAVLSGGTFSGGSANITVSGAFTISGCAFTSTSGTFSTSANFTISSGSFTHNSGTLTLTATSTFTVSNTGGTTFYNLTFAPTAANSTFTITSTATITVSNTFSYAGTKTITLNTGTIHVTGNISTASNTVAGSGGSAILRIDGTGSQSITGNTAGGDARLPDIVVNKSSGTLTLSGVISSVGNWTVTAGTVSAGGSVMCFFGAITITGSHTLGSVWFGANGTYTIASGTTLTIAHTLGYGSGGNCPVLNTGTINAQGNLDLSFNTTQGGTGGSATIVINGSGTQTLSGSSVSSSGRLCHIQINKSASDTLRITDHISPFGNWTYTTGIIDPTTSEVLFTGTKTITGSDSLYDVTFSGTSASTYTIASGTVLKVGGKFTINGTAAVTLNTGDIYAKGNISITNTSTTTAGTATLTINGTGDQTLTGSGVNGGGKLPKVIIDKSSGTLTLASLISVSGNWTYTQGNVSAGTSSVFFYGTSNLDGEGSSTMSFYTVGIAGTITLTGNLDANNNLTIGSGATLSAGSYGITVGGNWNNSTGTWTYGTGTVTFDGSNYKQIKHTSSGSVVAETFYNLAFNRRAGSITMASPVTVNNSLTLTKGHVKTTSSNYLLLIDNATCTGGNDSAYVHGPVWKSGNDAFTFPLGDTTLADTAYHPLGMTAPANIGDTFAATYFAAAQSYGATLASGDTAVSSCQYWTFNRGVSSSSTPTVSLTWNSNCDNTAYSEMRVLLWNGTQWNDLGQASVTITNSRSGTLLASSATSFAVNPAPITIGYATVLKSYSLLSKTPDGGYFNTVGHELYFGFDEEYKDGDGNLSYSIRSLNDNQAVTLLANSNNSPAVSYGNNHYRIDLYNTSNAPLSNGYYMLEVTNEKNEKWYLRFKI